MFHFNHFFGSSSKLNLNKRYNYDSPNPIAITG